MDNNLLFLTSAEDMFNTEQIMQTDFYPLFSQFSLFSLAHYIVYKVSDTQICHDVTI